MAAGEERDSHAELASRDGRRELAPGEVEVASGRVSIARRVTPARRNLPFTNVQLAGLDEALTMASRITGLHFSVYLGDLGEDTRARAEELHAAVGSHAPDAVVIAVSPGQRVVEIVTGSQASWQLADRGCKLAVMSMVASFREGDLAGGLSSGLRVLADQAGPPAR
ncbi:MAG: DUF5130 family protein [Pseudonocardiaceae bacterium]